MIKEIKIENFEGIKDFSAKFDGKINLLAGPIGYGKTSFIDAIRVAITGNTPNRKIIHNGADKAVITVTDESGNVTQRTFAYNDSTGMKQTIKYNGKTTTKKSLKALAEAKGVNEDLMNIISNPSSLMEMDITKRSEFFLSIIPVNLTFDRFTKLASISEKAISKIHEVFAKRFSDEDEFPLSELDDIYSVIYDKRTILKNEIKNGEAKSVYDGIIPAESEEMLNEELKGILEKESFVERAMEDNKKRLAAIEKKTLAEEEIKRLNSALKEYLDVKEYTSEEKEKLNKEEESCRKQISELTLTIADYTKKIEQNEKIVIALNADKCPLCDKIDCPAGDEKLSIQEELTNDNMVYEKNIKEMNILLDKQNLKLKEVLSSKEDIVLSDSKLLKKQHILENIEILTKTMPEIPEEIKIELIDYEDAKKLINDKLLAIGANKEALRYKAKLADDKNELKILDEICNALKSKSKVRDSIMNYFVGPFEKYINVIANNLELGFNIKFISDNGIVIYKVKDDGSMVDFDSLSSGEKLIVTFLIFDMVNEINKIGLLVLDNLDRLDKNSFEELMNIVMSGAIESKYEAIVCSMVDHKDLIDVMDDISSMTDVNRISY